MKDCVEHFIEGRCAWQVGLAGFFVRIRGLTFTLSLTFLTMGTPFWWPASFPQKIEIELRYATAIFLPLLGFIIAGGFLYLRNRSRRSLDIKHHMHEIAHYLRDYQTKMFKKAPSHLSSSHDDDDNNERFRDYVNCVCERIKDYFSKIINDNTIEVAIRLAVEKNDEQNKPRIVYHTVGRSSGLSSGRADTSEDVAANEGIARFLIEEKECKGVLIYNDLEKAAKIGAFKITDNEKKYPAEVVTMMVSPLNGWDGKRQSMIGIIYVTSRNKSPFKIEHTDMMRYIADTAAKSISFVVDRLRMLKKMPSLAGRRA